LAIFVIFYSAKEDIPLTFFMSNGFFSGTASLLEYFSKEVSAVDIYTTERR
jgi:hypothetical protein